MDDINVVERLVADEMQRRAGPDPVVDDAAIFSAITATQSPKWRFQSMFSATKFVVAGAIVALVGGFLLAGVLTQPSNESVPAVGASASAQIEPTTGATAESEPVPDATLVPPSDSYAGPGLFTPTGSLDRGRAEHTTTLLSDGRVLVVGGADYSRIDRVDWVTSVEAWDPLTGSFSSAGELTEGRNAHTATLLADGRVLVAGGSDNDYGTTGLASAEIWDPATESFSPASPLLQSRGRHTATLLPDGRVLVVGGVVVENDDDRVLASAEIWDPATESFSPTGSLDAARAFHTATLLPDGRVLVVGGANPDGAWPAPAEIWDPRTESFGPAGALSELRSSYTATLLSDGRVLIAGGVDLARDGHRYPPAEIWNPATESFELAVPLGTGRFNHAATLLQDSRVLLVGGSGASGVLASAEVWEPGEGQPEADDAATTTTPDLLPGADLATEEVEPGVYRVLSDGLRDQAGAERDRHAYWRRVGGAGNVKGLGHPPPR
jgi:hypothetical protein